jgi:hypothetical protein
MCVVRPKYIETDQENTQMKIHISKWPALLLCTGAALAPIGGSLSNAQAQNNPGGGGQNNNGGNAGQGGNRSNFRDMTPEQRQQMQAEANKRRAQEQQTWLRQAMAASGANETAAQDAVIAFVEADEKARLALQEQARALSALLIDPATTDEQFKTAVVAFRTANAAEVTRRQTELASLDAATKYSTQPRMETLLTVLGVLGSEISNLGGLGTIFPESPYGNRGAGGRGGRGGRGGQGGQGGQGGTPNG